MSVPRDSSPVAQLARFDQWMVTSVKMWPLLRGFGQGVVRSVQKRGAGGPDEGLLDRYDHRLTKSAR
jgi:hypothetical protein